MCETNVVDFRRTPGTTEGMRERNYTARNATAPAPAGLVSSDRLPDPS